MHQGFPAWVNGSPANTVSVADRAVAYGDGVFETLRMHPKPALEAFHLERLSLGLKALNIPVDVRQIQRAVADYSRQHNPGLIKVIVSRGEGGRGYLAPDDPSPVTIIQGFGLPVYQTEWYRSGINLFSCKTPLTVNPRLQGIKHLNRLEQVLARNEFCGDEFQEGLMSTPDGYLREGTMSNLFIVRDSQVITPSLEACAVQGTMQRHIIEKCSGIVGNVSECATLVEQDLLSAEEAFICNSVFGIWPIKSFKQQPVKLSKSGIAHQLQQEVSALYPCD